MFNEKARPEKDYPIIKPSTSDYSLLDLLHNCTSREVRLSAKSSGFIGTVDILLATPLPSQSSPQKNQALGLFYVGESSRRWGFNVEYWDARHENENLLWTKAECANIIGFTAITGFQLLEFIRLAEKLKAKFPNKIIILGGPHATLTDPQMNLEGPIVDFVVFGEGELRLPALMRAIYVNDGIELVDGIGFKNDSGDIIIQPSTHVPDPEKGHLVKAVSEKTLPYFIAATMRNEMILPVSRGCPWSVNSCYFCSVGKQYCDSYRKIPFKLWSSDIMDVYKNVKIRHIELEDENSAFAANPKEPYLPFLKSLGITSHLHMRSNQLLDANHLMWLSSMGIKRIHVGIESGNKRILNEVMHKNEALEGHLIAAENIANAEIELVATYIVANPTETWEEMVDTMNLAERISKIFPVGMHRATIYLLAALPGAQIYHDIEQMKLFISFLEKVVEEKEKTGEISKKTWAEIAKWYKLPRKKSNIAKLSKEILEVCKEEDSEHPKVADSIQEKLYKFLVGEMPLSELKKESDKWNWPTPNSMRGWANVSAAYNPYLPKYLNAIYPIAGLHFNKHHKTAQNFPGWRRILIYPFEILASLRYKFKYFKFASFEVMLINRLLSWASRKSVGEKIN